MPGIREIVVLVLIAIVVWYGFKLIGRGFQKGRDGMDEARRKKPESKDDTVAMVQCSVCSDFVPEGSATDCDKDNCPY